MLDGDIVIGMCQFHLLKWILAIARLNLFLSLAGLLFYWDTACLSDLYIYHSLQGSEFHLGTQVCYIYVSCYSADTSKLVCVAPAYDCQSTSSVLRRISFQLWKLLTRPLDLTVTACFLCIHTPLSFVEHPQ